MDGAGDRDRRFLRRVGWMVAGWIMVGAAVLGSEEGVEPAAGEERSAPEEKSAGTEVQEEGRDAPYRQIERLAEVMLLIRRHAVTPQSYEDILDGALRGMMMGVDPYSAFMDSEAYDDIQNETTGKYSGIGIQVGMRDGALIVIAPIEDSPGFRAGLLTGDRILEIDGRKTLNMTLKEAVDLLRGPAGEKVRLHVLRSGESVPRTVDVVREEIKVSTVKGTRMVRDGIGYVRITQFSEPTVEFLRQALDELRGKGMGALILDLRGNPGGLLRSAVDVSAEFLPADTLVVATRGRKGVESELRSRGSRGRAHTAVPLAVLVNSGSASASEIVAGALQDHHRAVVIGDRTFGKGSVQSVIPLKTDSRCAVRLTTARYHTPGGREIHEKGIEPDIAVPMTPAEWRRVQMRRSQAENPEAFTEADKQAYADAVDRPMERALELLQAVGVYRAGLKK